MSDDAARVARKRVNEMLALWDRMSVAWDLLLEHEQVELVETAERLAAQNEASG